MLVKGFKVLTLLTETLGVQFPLLMSTVLLLLVMIASPANITTVTPKSTNAMSTNATSGRDEIKNAQSRHNWIFGAYVVVLALTVFGTYFVWRSGNKVQDAVQADANARILEAKNKAMSLEGDLNAEKGKVAGLQKDAADALTEQKKVEIKLSKQQERTASIEHANILLRSDLNKAAGEVAELQTAAADARRKQAEAEERLAKVQRRIGPRGVNTGALIRALRDVPPPPPGKIFIKYAEDGPGTASFASTMWVLGFNMVWPSIAPPVGVPRLSTPKGDPLIGNVEIMVFISKNPPEYAKALCRGITAMMEDDGLQMGVTGWGEDGALPPGEVWIEIGPKL